MSPNSDKVQYGRSPLDANILNHANRGFPDIAATQQTQPSSPSPKSQWRPYSLSICKSSHFTHFQPHFSLGVDGEAGQSVCHVVRHFSSAAADEILATWKLFAALSAASTVAPRRTPVSLKKCYQA